MTPRIGGLFFGYGGLDQAVQSVTGGELAWVSEFDKGACKIIGHRYPNVPNLGDITKVDWSRVEPVDVITGGSPCQDLSHAGKRGGMTAGTRSNLWVSMREAIATLRPSTVIWENVRGAYSACADSDLGSCPRCVDPSHPGGHAPLLRALGRVLGDLSSLGYDAQWHGLRAADVGAPHGRFRVFVVASLANSQGNPWRVEYGTGVPIGGLDAADDASVRGSAGRPPDAVLPLRPSDGHGLAARPQQLLPTPAAYDGERGGPQHPDKRIAGGHSVTLQDAVYGMLPTPQARDWKGAGPADMNRHDPNLSAIGALLPTPAVNDMGAGKTVEAWDAWTAKMKTKHGNGNGHGPSLSIEAQRLLPTPRSTRGGSVTETAYAFGAERTDEHRPQGEVALHWTDWGIYADAINRWEHLTRPAPAPTQPSKKGTPQLSAAFSEWLMGLPAGWVTDVPGITRNEALKALGNGVCPPQAVAALQFLLNIQGRAA